MDSIINIRTFVEYLTYYIKITIYINKGTTDDVTLEKCIKLYNKYKTIETCDKMSEEDETAVRKCYKRLNLILKVDNDNNPIDIRDKKNQIQMFLLNPHSSIVKDDLSTMLKYANDHNLNILPDVPLLFILRDSKYKSLLWQYTRSLFYISQILISSGDSANEKIKAKKKMIFDESMDQLETILETISTIEQERQLSKLLALDKFLNAKLVKPTKVINKSEIQDAGKEVKEKFLKQGIDNDSSLNKMIDSISDKLSNVDLTNGNILQNIFSIAHNVANEVKHDLESNPEKIQQTLSTVVEIVKDTIKNDQIPSNLKNMFDNLISEAPKMISASDNEDSNIEKNFENILEQTDMKEFLVKGLETISNNTDNGDIYNQKNISESIDIIKKEGSIKPEKVLDLMMTLGK